MQNDNSGTTLAAAAGDRYGIPRLISTKRLLMKHLLESFVYLFFY